MGFAYPVNAQTNEWTWMSGTKTPQPSVYGTLGVPSADNLPGNRQSAVSWTDSKGNLWLFGGNGEDSSGKIGYLNDLWTFNPSTDKWVWMGGKSTFDKGFFSSGVSGTLRTPAAVNVPQGRMGAVSWTDANGNLWLFGGSNNGSNYFNDLWTFNPSTNEWAWVSGSNAESCTSCNQSGVYGSLGTPAPGNVPGSRVNAVSWFDSNGNLWLLGGYGLDSTGTYGYLNDLWKFNPSTNEWTWMGGSTISNCNGECGQSGLYGAEGIPSASNVPGGRSMASGWTDSNGNFWLFGGLGFDSAGTFGLLNDLWEFNPSTNEWTWMGGSNTYPASCSNSFASQCGIPGIYGTLQTAATANSPGARQGPISWTDSKGNLWLFGGDGIDSVGKWGYLNDLWEFNPSTNEWTWMSGSNTVICASTYCGQPGVYGALQTPALGNAPSGRDNAASWTDSKGNLWLFGGGGVNVVGNWGYFQDLWQFQPNTGGQPITATPTFSPGSGSYTSVQTVTIDDTTPGAMISYTINGNTPASVYTAPIPISSSETIEAIAGAPGYANSTIATATYTVQVPPAATPTFSPTSGTYATNQTVTINDATPGATIYFTTDGSMPTTGSAIFGGPVTVSSSEAVRAIAVANNFLTSEVASAVYTIGSTSTLGQWAWMGGTSQQNQRGVYGSLQTPAAGNIPGARNASTSWTDQSSNLWLFGGIGYDVYGNEGNLNDLWKFNPSSKQWAWMGGSYSVPCYTVLGVKTCTGKPGVYGTLGTPGPSNIPGGRWGAAGWMDSAGHHWLFGGYGMGANGQVSGLNDLWEFDPSTMEWTWMGGSSREGLSNFSPLGERGVYGSLGVPAADNIPGSRNGAATWVDSKGNFWLFGGTGEDSLGNNDVILNDLWEFNPSTHQWAWMGGSDRIDVVLGYQSGSYGTLGVSAAANTPGSRTGAAAWTDASGNLWLFGGNSGAGKSEFNDLWKYDPSIHQWTWMKGASSSYCPYDPFSGFNTCTAQPEVYGSLGVPAGGNTPGSGSVLASWTDHNGNFWLMGGESSDITGRDNGFHVGPINSLWVFNPSISEWAWMGGDHATSNCEFIIINPLPAIICGGSHGTYGNQSVFTVGNIPSARSGAVSWTDKNGNLWLFSGAGTDLFNTPGSMNDLWQYQPSTTTLPAAAAPIFSLKTGIYTSAGSVTIANGMANARIYYTTDGTTPTTSSTLYTGAIPVTSTKTIQAIATAPGYRNSGVASGSYTFPGSVAAPTFSLPSGTYGSVQSVVLSDATPGTKIFYTTDETMPLQSSPVYRGPITVSSSETINAVAGILGYFVLDGIAADYGPYVASANASASYTVNLPQVATPNFSVPSATYTSAQTVTISDATAGATIYYTTNGIAPSTLSTVYKGPITVSTSESIEAIAVANGLANSEIASAQYIINLPLPPSDFSIAASPASLTLAPGESGSITIAVTPLDRFNSAVAFSCSGLPLGASCSFSPATITPSGAKISTTITVTTSSTSTAFQHNSNSLLPRSLLAVVFCCVFWKKRRRPHLLLLLVLSGTSMYLLNGCGTDMSSSGGTGGGSPVTSQPVTSIITVTATAGSLQHTATFSLTVD
jgi:N-acetylneuraminic acid mutarotase